MSTPSNEKNKNVFLAHLKRYIDLNKTEEAFLETKLTYRNYRKGQYIVQSGDVCRYQSFIVSGKVRTFFIDKNGSEHIVMFGIENWWTADLGSFISQSPADFEVQCLENTEVVQLSYEDSQQLYKELPKIERFFRLLLQNAYVNTQKRIVQNYSLTAKERYLQFCEDYPEMVQRLPQYMIASYLGITKEFLSNIRSQIAKES